MRLNNCVNSNDMLWIAAIYKENKLGIFDIIPRVEIQWCGKKMVAYGFSRPISCLIHSG
jgi:hypothetical protein